MAEGDSSSIMQASNLIRDGCRTLPVTGPCEDAKKFRERNWYDCLFEISRDMTRVA